jgi:hypothetical protein
VTVRGVAWRITWPMRKSSKKLPGLVFDILQHLYFAIGNETRHLARAS